MVRYGYEQILLLALLVSTQQIAWEWIPGIASFVRDALDAAAAELASLTAAGRGPMICSELVYRCYEEAGEQYHIRIVGADYHEGFLFAAPQPTHRTVPTQPVGNPAEIAVVQAKAKAFIAQYQLA